MAAVLMDGPLSLALTRDDKDTGVYFIRNKLSKKVYVGSSAVSLKERWVIHRWHLRNGKHPNRHLQSAWNKYGSDTFEFLIKELCTPEQCLKREQYWIDKMRSANNHYGYNLSPTASNCYGVKHSDETRARTSLALKRRFSKPEEIEKMCQAQRRRYAEPGEREKISRTTKAAMTLGVCAKLSTKKRQYFSRQETRDKQAEMVRNLWKDPAYRKMMLEARQKAKEGK